MTQAATWAPRAGLSLRTRRQGAHLPPERRFLPPEGRLYPYPMLEELCHDRKPTSTYSSFTPRSSTPLFYLLRGLRSAAASSGSVCIAGHRRRRGPPDWHGQHGREEKGPEPASKKRVVVAVRPPPELSDSPTLTRFPIRLSIGILVRVCPLPTCVLCRDLAAIMPR